MCLVTQLYPTLCDHWTVACQAPLSMGFSRQEHWSRLPCPSPGDLPNLGIEPTSPVLAGGFFIHWAIGKHLANSCGLIAKSCPTLCDPMDCSLPGFSVQGTSQARTPEWVAIFFSRGSSPLRDHTWVSYIAGKFFTNWDTREAQTQLWVCRKFKFSLLGLSGIFFFFFFKYLDPQLVESMASQPTDTRADCPNSTPTLTSKDKRQNTWP